MSGLDVAAGAAQVVSLAFQIFGGCIEAYKFFHVAQRIGVDGDFLRIKIQIERDRLQRWADRVGLASARPNTRLNWTAIVDILRLQQAILTSADKLKERYGLDLPEADDRPGDSERVESCGLERFLVALRPEFYGPGNASKVIAAANGPIKRIRWAAVGREKTTKVVDDLGSLNGDLERLLESVDREWLQSGMTVLLRELLSRSTSLHEIEELQSLLHPRTSKSEESLSSVANFKRIRLVLGVDKRDDEIKPEPSRQITSTMPALKMLQANKLTSSKPDEADVRVQHATYGVRPVLIEWRKPGNADASDLKKKMQSLALLLGSTPPSFAALRCMGLLAAKSSGNFGLVYEMPPMLDADPDAEFEHRSLHALILAQRRISLQTRVHVACHMAQAVLHLHTAGWLHKNIRSENVIFVASSNSSTDEFMAGDPYLVGYDHARPDMENTITDRLETSLYTELYLHPERRGASRSRYRKCFDLFALGCLLVEMALWRHLVDVFTQHDDQDWGVLIRDAEAKGHDLKLPSLRELSLTTWFSEEIVHAAGPLYLQAVQLCLSKDRDDMDEVSLDVQRNIVECLRECRV